MISKIDKFFEGIKSQLHNSSDIGTRLFIKGNTKIGLIYLVSMTDEQFFGQFIYQPLDDIQGEVSIDLLLSKTLNSGKIEKIGASQVIEKILEGCVILCLEGEKDFVSIDIQSFPKRVPSEPPTSPVIRGPREGFTEDIKTNITLLRRRFYTKNLVLREIKVGKFSQTKVVVSYLDKIVDKKIVKEVIKRLKKIEIDGIIDSFYIEKYLQGRPYSFFKTVGNSEKPDVVAAKMLEGRVSIIVDGSPIVLTLPFIFIEDLQSSNDYYTNHYYATLIRYIRLIGLFLSIAASGSYLALRLFHFNVIPTKFLITISDTTQSIPFTPFVELLFISLLFQILYEVSLRLPSYLGLATSIVGALILGDTGVNAGLISPPGVIVVALSKIAVYALPDQASQITFLQFVFLILGGSLGIFGIIGGMIYIINYLNSIDSYGAPYLAPYSPRVQPDLKDGLIKQSIIKMNKRPMSFSVEDRVRQKWRIQYQQGKQQSLLVFCFFQTKYLLCHLFCMKKAKQIVYLLCF